MYSLLVFGRSACHYKVCSPFLSPGQEWKATRLREKKDTAARQVELMRVRISHDNAQKVSFAFHLTVGSHDSS